MKTPASDAEREILAALEAHETANTRATELRYVMSVRPEQVQALLHDLSAMRALAETLKQEAQIHAQEARTANSTIAEIYKLCTGATGEPGNWNGAEPVREALSAMRAKLEEAQRDAARYRYLRDMKFDPAGECADGVCIDKWEFCSGEQITGEKADAAIDASMQIQEAGK